VRTWSYCGGLDLVRTLRRDVSTRADMPTNYCEVGTVVETTTGLKSPPLRWFAIEPAHMALVLLPRAGAEAEKGL
jgi:hypothetical protein